MARRIQKGKTRGRWDIGRFAFRAGSTNKRPLGLLSAPAKHSSCQNFTKILRLTENRETKKERKISGILRRGATGFSARFLMRKRVVSFLHQKVAACSRTTHKKVTAWVLCPLSTICPYKFQRRFVGILKIYNSSKKKEEERERVKKKKKSQEIEMMDRSMDRFVVILGRRRNLKALQIVWKVIKKLLNDLIYWSKTKINISRNVRNIRRRYKDVESIIH